MNSYNPLARAQWSSYLSYVLVTTGAIVGLGNIFNFPFLVTEYGGIFILFYVGSELLISIPLLFSELLIGRRAKQNPVGAISLAAMESGTSRHWRFLGWLCFLILGLTLAYYTVSVGFSLGYWIDTVHHLFSNEPSFDFLMVAHSNLVTSSLKLTLCFLFFLVATMLVVLRGINRGLETISFITVPAYFLILIGLAIYTSINGDFMAAVNYLFHTPTHATIWPALFAALTFAFFKLNVGMGSMIVYGSYLPYSVPLGQSTAIIVGLDALASILAYFIIGPLMMQSNLIGHDVTLSYKNIMLIFSMAPHGVVIASLFFLAAVIAAWTPTIAMAESAVLTLIERFEISRCFAVLLVSLGATLVGMMVVLSYLFWPTVMVFNQWTIPDFIKNVASDMATPLSALAIAVFSGWMMKREITANELHFNPVIYALWRLIIRYIAPIFIIVIFLGIGFN